MTRHATTAEVSDRLQAVYVLLAADGSPCSVWERRSDAEARRDRWNADPMLDEETPDPDAPYSVEVFAVRTK